MNVEDRRIAHREWNRKSVERREARNLEIVAAELERRGGHCVYPGCTETKIEWHHRDPATKTKSIGSSVRVHAEPRLRAELALCDPLCRRHHMAVDGRSERARTARLGVRATKRKADSKLSEDDVREIRRLWSSGGVTQRSLAETFSVVQPLISAIVNRRRWAWLSD